MKNEFIYQIFPQTFCEKDNKNGIGNIKGIISKLNYIKSLGITSIWISPLTKSPFKDSGYDVEDYYEINPVFGDMKDFDLLIKKANDLNLKIIIDIVVNHTSNKHIWFKKALEGDKKYINYYHFKDPVNDGPPTNWKSKMGGSSWEFVPKLNKYYLHLFSKEQPDLNWENEEVRLEILKILNFWKSKGVKGFRFDVCNLYDKPHIFEDDLEGDGRRFYTDGARLENYLKFMNKNSFNNETNFFTVGEISSTTKEKSVNYAKVNNNELDCVFTFLHLKVDYINNNKWTYTKPNLTSYWNTLKEWQLYFQNNDSTLALFMNNHDQPRSISRFGDDKNYWYQSATSIFGFTSLLKGVPFIYQGEEIGMTNMSFNSISDFKDIETLGNSKELLLDHNEETVLKILSSKSRDNARSVMQWDNSLNAGFSNAEKIDLLINKNYKIINVNNQINDESSVFNFYKKLITLRVSDEIFTKGKVEFDDNLDYCYKRIIDNREILVITNWTSKNKPLTLNINNYKIIINNYQNINFKHLLPYQLLVLERF
ncbi:alpha,alpha-phosphotrehalase [Spiroplasma turonicum]|uniref:Trehalose-6-phosphate hydrolase n=1 Tax=Spiroplasma turonicum TaxID=216946 RepID=A0A0K1P7N0_9MOLU|nr:alpha,alpha-phosphotrehalase [Spiroplasma turonicum]AKU79892.1 trehalose-6-phosphate hydrolase [Spiroplasma turonicum]ALX70903.1 trehalose-6-phosphate hydrolase [Spiroplasma turonicum]